MPKKCAVPTCSSSKGSVSFFKNRVSYFSTPKDPMLLAEWERNLHLLDGQHIEVQDLSISFLRKIFYQRENGKEKWQRLLYPPLTLDT